MISKFLKRLRIFKRLRELEARFYALEKLIFKRLREHETRLDAVENAVKRLQELETRLDALEKKTTALNKLNEPQPLSNNLIDEWLNGKEDDK